MIAAKSRCQEGIVETTTKLKNSNDYDEIGYATFNTIQLRVHEKSFTPDLNTDLLREKSAVIEESTNITIKKENSCENDDLKVEKATTKEEFQCNVCKTKFALRQNLKDHLIKTHIRS